MKRFLDILASLLALLIFSPVLLIFGLLIILEDGWPILFKQERIGLGAKPFVMYKLRSMRNRKEGGMAITVGNRDPRVLRVGGIIRKYKLDEIPQLINVLKGEMSLVGPRPEVPKYVAMYNEKQRKVLSIRPGITDLASIAYRNENEILAESDNPEQTYINEVMPNKLDLNLEYVRRRSLVYDLQLILKTLRVVIYE